MTEHTRIKFIYRITTDCGSGPSALSPHQNSVRLNDPTAESNRVSTFKAMVTVIRLLATHQKNSEQTTLR